MKWIDVSLFITLFMTGLYAGIGFFTLMGGNPAVSLLSDHTFAEFWQRVDGFMGKRMPVFGPLLMLSIIVSIVLLIPERKEISFWLMVFSLFIIIVDLVFTLSINHPLNQLIQSWDLQQLPDNVQVIKSKVYNAFNYRSAFMIGSFVFALLSVWSRK